MSDLSAFYAPTAGKAPSVNFGLQINAGVLDLYDGYASAWDNVASITRTGITVGNGTESFRYHDLHNRIHYSYSLILGSTSTIGTRPTLLDGKDHTDTYATGYAAAFDTSASRWHPVAIDRDSATDHARINVTATAPFTWTTGDILVAQWSRRITQAPTTARL